jgi:hypothetical protein
MPLRALASDRLCGEADVPVRETGGQEIESSPSGVRTVTRPHRNPTTGEGQVPTEGAGSPPERREPPAGESDRGRHMPTNPQRHAAELLNQANQLMQLAREFRREAQRLSASLDQVASQRPVSEPTRPLQRRFAPASERTATEQIENSRTEIQRIPDDLEISDGARIMITGMAITGSSREEMLDLMRDELGLENADAILESLNL